MRFPLRDPAVMNVDTTWKTFALRTLFGCAAIFATVRLALARDGVARGSARSFVTVAGTLTGVRTSAVTMTFTFHRRGGAALCAPQVRDVPVATGGAFSAAVPIDDPCPAALFDGSDVLVDVAVAEGDAQVVVVAPNSTINPVPYAHYASQYGTPDCPVGYEVIARDDNVQGRTCGRKRTGQAIRSEDFYDEVVRVGSGPTAFWIDRYEATLWADEEGRHGVGDSPDRAYGAFSPLPDTFPANGQWARPMGGDLPPTVTRLWALSIRRVRPSGRLTWYQAQAACRLSGKRLPTREEWLAAAQGHSDPGSSSGAGFADCRTQNNEGPRTTGMATGPGLNCSSIWGVEDMVGNMAEWVDEWYVAPPREVTDGGFADGAAVSWPPGYRSDIVFGAQSAARAGSGLVYGLPAAVLRGGNWADGAGAGVFAMVVVESPSYDGVSYGFRCMIPR